MKHLCNLLLASLLLVTASCTDSNDDITPEMTNANANDTRVNPAYGRLEMPRLKGGSDNRVVIHSTSQYGITYIVEWNDTKRSQRWTAYRLDPANSVRNGTRDSYDNTFAEDASIPTAYRSTLSQYYNSGYQRGHICPSVDRLASKEANAQTFLLTNIQPQLGGFNTGIWLIAENHISGYGDIPGWNKNYFRDTLYIAKGGTIDDPTQYTTTNRSLLVPKYFYMAIMRVKNGQYSAIGLWFEHKRNSETNIRPYAISIDELERRTGIDFFCNLPDDREEVIERQLQTDLWLP